MTTGLRKYDQNAKKKKRQAEKLLVQDLLGAERDFFFFFKRRSLVIPLAMEMEGEQASGGRRVFVTTRVVTTGASAPALCSHHPAELG